MRRKGVQRIACALCVVRNILNGSPVHSLASNDAGFFSWNPCRHNPLECVSKANHLNCKECGHWQDCPWCFAARTSTAGESSSLWCYHRASLMNLFFRESLCFSNCARSLLWHTAHVPGSSHELFCKVKVLQ